MTFHSRDVGFDNCRWVCFEQIPAASLLGGTLSDKLRTAVIRHTTC